MIKTSIYSSKNLCYHLDERHKRSEDGYSKIIDTVAWADKIKKFVGHKLEPLTKEVSKHLRAPMYAGSNFTIHLWLISGFHPGLGRS